MAGQAQGRRIRWWPVLLVLLIALVTNAAFLLLTSNSGKTQIFELQRVLDGGPFVAAADMGNGRWVSTSIDNRVVAHEGDDEIASIAFDFVVSSIAYHSRPELLYVGTADGKVQAYNRALQPEWTTDLGTGRLISLAPAGADRLVAVTGIGSYGNRFYFTILDTTGTIVYQHQIGRPVQVAGAILDLALLGGQLSNVNAVDFEGRNRWESLLQREVSVLVGDEDNARILAGDIKGNAYLLNAATGAVEWQSNISQWKITAALPLSRDLLAFADEEGAIHLLSASGEKLMASQATQDRVVSLMPTGESQARALYRSGRTAKVDVAGLAVARRVEQVRPWRLAFNLLLGCLAAGLAVSTVPAWRRQASNVLREIRASWLAYLFILPSIAGALLFFFLPAAQAVYYSLTNYRPGDPVTFIGLENYAEILFRDPFFWQAVRNMLIILVTGVLKILTMPLLAALLIYHLRSSTMQYWARTAMLIPSVVPALITVMMWKMLYAPGDMGFVNRALDIVGLGRFQTAWLGDARTALGAIIFAGFPWIDAFALLVYLGGLINMNQELNDAAAIDGANWWRRLRSIEWPLLAPQRNLLVFFAILAGIQEFSHVYVFTMGGPAFATMVPALQMYLRLFRNMEIGYASALGLLLMLTVLAMTLLQRWLQRHEYAT